MKFKDLENYLKAKGWEYHHGKKHDIYYKDFGNGDLRTVTLSRGKSKTISEELFSRILRTQLKMTKKEFLKDLQTV